MELVRENKNVKYMINKTHVMRKRIMALLCCVAVLVTGVISGYGNKAVTQAGEAEQISLQSTTYLYVKEGGYLNVNYSGISDFGGSLYQNFFDAEFSKKYVTYEGGLTYEELSKGLTRFCVETDNILQVLWLERNEAFDAGASFTITKGALIPYKNTAGQIVTKPLDADYTFEFLTTPQGAVWNDVLITKSTTFSFDEKNHLTSGASGTVCTDIMIPEGNVAGYNPTYTYIQDDNRYAAYIDIAGIPYSQLSAMGVKIMYILDGPNRLLRIEDWGELRNTLRLGDYMLFKKGMPLNYTANGKSIKATLDSDYVYMVTDTTAEHNQYFKGMKYDVAHNEYKLHTVDSLVTGTQGNDQIINVNFATTDKDATCLYTGYEVDLFENAMAKPYIDFAGYSVEEAAAMCNAILISTADGTNVLQFQFNATAVNKLVVGDKIVLKKGLPILYINQNTILPDTATLNDEYTFTVTDKYNDNGTTRLTFSCALSGTYSLRKDNLIKYENNIENYVNILYADGCLADAQNFEMMLSDEEVMKDYLVVSGKTYEQLNSPEYGYHLFGYYLDALKGLRIKYQDLGLQNGNYVLFKEGLPITYTTTSGEKRTVFLDGNYGYRYNGTEFVYDPTVEEVTEMSFGLNTNQMVTGDESGEQVSNIFITGNPFPFTNYYWLDLGTEQEKYLDYAGCKNAAAVKAGTTIRYILADANMQVLQLRFGNNAIDKLQVGDEIVLKEGLPLAYSDSDSGARAYLDDTYTIMVTGIEGSNVTLQVVLKGTYSLTTGMFYQGTEYMDISYGTGSLTDAQDFEGISLGDAVIKKYLAMTGESYDSLKEKGYGMQAFSVPAFKGLRMNYDSCNLKMGDTLLIKKGLPITYTTASGKTKIVYLDKTYGYMKNGANTFIYDASITKVFEPEKLSFDFMKEYATFVEGGFTKINAMYTTDATYSGSYMEVDLLTDNDVQQFVRIGDYTTQELLNNNVRVVFIPTANVIQFNLGSLSLQGVEDIVLLKGMTIAYNDNGPKRLVLNDDYAYQVTARDTGDYLISRIEFFHVTVEVDGTTCIDNQYRVGSTIDLSGYKNISKGKVMSIMVNGVATQEKKIKVIEDMDIVVRNRSDLCVVIFQDEGTVYYVKEYVIGTKKLNVPDAPDKDGYDDSWEKFKLVNGVIHVNAVHEKKHNAKPVVELTSEDYDGNYVTTPENDKADISSPQTGDDTMWGVWLVLCMLSAAICVLVIRRKKFV